MTRRYDLHTHSTASDGTLVPVDLVARAAESGVDVLALTDHDTTAGVAEAAQAAAMHGVELIPGVEVSVTWERQTVHIVGLKVRPGEPTLEQGLARLREFRGWRAEEIGRRLAKHGIPGAYEGACRYASGAVVGRTHFARFLVGQGHARDVRQVFQRFLVRNKPGHVPGQWAELGEAVGWIKAAGGQAVVAHAARYPMTGTRLRRLLGEFKECGGEAIEVVSGSHSPDDRMVMAEYARRFGLLASAGSDYHGPQNPYLELGRLPALPAGCTPVWENWSACPGQQH